MCPLLCGDASPTSWAEPTKADPGIASTPADCHNAVTGSQRRRWASPGARISRFASQNGPVNAEDPFQVLGLDRTATADDLRRQRRHLALLCHPDLGGDPAHMSAINSAFDAAMASVADIGQPERIAAQPSAHPAPPSSPTAHNQGVATPSRTTRPWRNYEHDPASFVVHCPPVDAFEALSVALCWFGDVVDDDPPYRLVALLSEPSACWCRLDLVADAGATTVDLTVAPSEGDPVAPTADEIRDLLVGAINEMGGQR